MVSESDKRFSRWLRALEARHTAELSFQEIRKGIQALSRRYVDRRLERGPNGLLDGRGKRAAFALFYTPLHLITVRRIVEALAPDEAAPEMLLDLGCGTGAGAAGWSLAASHPPQVRGVDLHGWAIDECRWNWRTLGLRGAPRRGDLARFEPGPAGRLGIVAAYAMNELQEDVRQGWLQRFTSEATRPGRLLIVEPIGRRMTPWWDQWAETLIDAGGRADEWEFREELPEPLATLEHAAGFRHSGLKARSLWL